MANRLRLCANDSCLKPAVGFGSKLCLDHQAAREERQRKSAERGDPDCMGCGLRYRIEGDNFCRACIERREAEQTARERENDIDEMLAWFRSEKSNGRI